MPKTRKKENVIERSFLGGLLTVFVYLNGNNLRNPIRMDSSQGRIEIIEALASSWTCASSEASIVEKKHSLIPWKFQCSINIEKTNDTTFKFKEVGKNSGKRRKFLILPFKAIIEQPCKVFFGYISFEVAKNYKTESGSCQRGSSTPNLIVISDLVEDMSQDEMLSRIIMKVDKERDLSPDEMSGNILCENFNKHIQILEWKEEIDFLSNIKFKVEYLSFTEGPTTGDQINSLSIRLENNLNELVDDFLVKTVLWNHNFAMAFVEPLSNLILYPVLLGFSFVDDSSFIVYFKTPRIELQNNQATLKTELIVVLGETEVECNVEYTYTSFGILTNNE